MYVLRYSVIIAAQTTMASYLNVFVASILSTFSVVFDQTPQRFLAQHVACSTTHVALLHKGPGWEEEVGMYIDRTIERSLISIDLSQ